MALLQDQFYCDSHQIIWLKNRKINFKWISSLSLQDLTKLFVNTYHIQCDNYRYLVLDLVLKTKSVYFFDTCSVCSHLVRFHLQVFSFFLFLSYLSFYWSSLCQWWIAFLYNKIWKSCSPIIDTWVQISDEGVMM